MFNRRCKNYQSVLAILEDPTLQGYKHPERQAKRQAAHQASAAALAMQVYGETSKSVPDPFPNSATDCDALLDARCVHSLNVSHGQIVLEISFHAFICNGDVSVCIMT